MGQGELNLEVVLKRVCIGYFYLVTLVFSLFAVYYWVKEMDLFMYISALSVVIHSFIFSIPYRLEYRAIKTLIPVYLVFISLVLYPFIVLYWAIGQVTVFMWYLLIPFAALIFFPIRTVVYWTIYVLVLFCSVFFTSYLLPDKYIYHLSNEESAILNIITIVGCLALVAYFTYYLNKVNQIKIELLRKEKENEAIAEKEEDTNDTNTIEDVAKYNELFKSVEMYMETKKPYCDSNFTITQLASAVDSNITYVSKAIKLNKDMNFNIFVNTYRINMIKDMLDKGYQNTFTIKYIYSSAGFKQQTTFNKVFKQIAGITPTDYIKNLNVPQEFVRK